MLNLPPEIRDLIYSKILTVEQNPILVPNVDEPPKFDTRILRVNRKIRDEATEILRRDNVWLTLGLHTPFTGSPHFWVDLLPLPATLFKPLGNDWLEFHHQRGTVIEIGHGCGALNTRPLGVAYQTQQRLFTYDKQSFAYLCLKLWLYVDIYRNMTVILNMPTAPPNNPRIVQRFISDFTGIRGLQKAACNGLQSREQEQQLEQRMTTDQQGWPERFRLMRDLSDRPDVAANAGHREESIHRYRILRLTSQVILQRVGHWGPSQTPFDYACYRVHVDFVYRTCTAIMGYISTLQQASDQQESDRKFTKLPSQFIDEAEQVASAALTQLSGASKIFRMKAHELRAQVYERRAEYRRVIAAPASDIRADLQDAALDFYIASLPVDRNTYPEQLKVDQSLAAVESKLGCTRAQTISRADIETITEPATGLPCAFEGRLLRRWYRTAADMGHMLRTMRTFPPSQDTMGLI
jgi:hypothetical protein